MAAQHGPPFCPECGELLALPAAALEVVCVACGFRQPAAAYEGQTIVAKTRKNAFRKYLDDLASERDASDRAAADAGATVKEKCPSCGNDQMTFHTMQLRSADEGQTVFYNCTKCRYKFSLNS